MFSFLLVLYCHFKICNFPFLNFYWEHHPSPQCVKMNAVWVYQTDILSFFLCIRSMLQQVLNIYVPSRGCVLLWNIFCHGLFHSGRVERKSFVSCLSCSELPRSSRGHCSVYLLHVSPYSFDLYSTTNCMLAGLPVVL
jgi:hypothetical protein